MFSDLSTKVAKKLVANMKVRKGRDIHYGRKIKEIEVDEYLLIQKFKEQKGLCHWSSLPLYEKYNLISKHPLAISVDRLNNDLGYSYEKIVLVRRMFNLGRSSFPEDQYAEVVQILKEEIKNG